MARGAKNVSDLESESKLSQIEELLRELMEGSERLVSMDFNVIIWASDPSELEEKTDEVEQLLLLKKLLTTKGIPKITPVDKVKSKMKKLLSKVVN